LVYIAFLTQIFKYNVKFEAKFDENNLIKLQKFLHQALHYCQIYDFTFDHYYKFKIIIVFKDIWVSKSKSIYVFYFLNVLNAWILSCGIY
jgi:prolipoprotein diacylglyceryltransferase